MFETLFLILQNILYIFIIMHQCYIFPANYWTEKNAIMTILFIFYTAQSKTMLNYINNQKFRFCQQKNQH